MKWISLDLEMSMPSGKIIEIGAVAGDLVNDEVPTSKFSIFVNPEEQLSEMIIKLTNIKQEDVDNAVLLPEAYNQFHKWIKEQGEDIMRNPITWGGGDSLCLMNQLGINQDDFVFGRTWFDVKKIYQFYRYSQGLGMQSGLAKSMVRLGMKFEGTKHRAVDDAWNTWLVAKNLLTKFKL